MIEVVIESIRVSLISQQRIVMLRDADGDRQVPMWIGPCEAEAIEIKLRETEVARPMTHDLLKIIVEDMGGTLHHVMINELRDSVFYALLFVDVDGEMREIDCRPSDALALAVRSDTSIYVSESVMESAGILPEADISENDDDDIEGEVPPQNETAGRDEELDAFRSFLDNLDDD